MSNLDSFAQISMGENTFRDRDPITMTLHYGQLDRWVLKEYGENIPVMNTSNVDNLEIGEIVKISESIFCAWIKLITMVDRTHFKKKEGHVKNKITFIANNMGYSNSKGFYKVIKPLYEVGLVDLEETEYFGNKMIDIIVYPYPVYASSDICNLVKCREWSKRESFGFALSAKGVKARKNRKKQDSTEDSNTPVNKSTQGTGNKSTQPPVNKSTQPPVNKSTQPPVNKSTHTNYLNLTNDLNISKDFNISNHLLEQLSELEAEKLVSYIIDKIEEEDLAIKLIERVIQYPCKTKKYENYFDILVESIKNERTAKTKNKSQRKEMVPDFIENKQNEQESSETVENKYIDFEKEKKKWEKILKQYAKPAETNEI